MSADDLHAHLDGGATTVARCWLVERKDRVSFGFTDHDLDLAFDGHAFRAGTGLTAKALSQTTGLSVDNSEAVGALADVAVTEADIAAGRFDGASVTCWLVNWANVAARKVLFRGTFGQIERAGGAFRAELRGLTEALNVPQGRSVQRGCSAILGDASCRVDLSQPGLSAELAVETVEGGRIFRWAGFTGFDDRWFERGRFRVLSGAAAGLVQVVKNDRLSAVSRTVELWEALAGVAAGDTVRIEAGCDKRADTCQLKFSNFLNFRGFPHVPGEDWLASYPVRTGRNDGGSLVR